MAHRQHRIKAERDREGEENIEPFPSRQPARTLARDVRAPAARACSRGGIQDAGIVVGARRQDTHTAAASAWTKGEGRVGVHACRPPAHPSAPCGPTALGRAASQERRQEDKGRCGEERKGRDDDAWATRTRETCERRSRARPHHILATWIGKGSAHIKMDVDDAWRRGGEGENSGQRSAIGSSRRQKGSAASTALPRRARGWAKREGERVRPTTTSTAFPPASRSPHRRHSPKPLERSREMTGSLANAMSISTASWIRGAGTELGLQ